MYKYTHSVADHFAPSKRWRLETVSDVLTTAGQHATEDVVVDTIIFISQAADLQAYAAHLLFDRLTNVFKPGSQSALALLAVYVVGEYGGLLISQSGAAQANAQATQGGGRDAEGKDSDSDSGDDSDNNKSRAVKSRRLLKYSGFTPVTESQVLDALQTVLGSVGTESRVRAYILTTLMKLTTRFPTSLPRLEKMLARYTSSSDLELQQRAVEYMILMRRDGMNPIRAEVVKVRLDLTTVCVYVCMHVRMFFVLLFSCACI
jgi:AP-1 complex subunit gamma-1